MNIELFENKRMWNMKNEMPHDNVDIIYTEEILCIEHDMRCAFSKLNDGGEFRFTMIVGSYDDAFTEDKIFKLAKNIGFDVCRRLYRVIVSQNKYKTTFRLFKNICENKSLQLYNVTYNIPIPNYEQAIRLDYKHTFFLKQTVTVCNLTMRMLYCTRFRNHFVFEETGFKKMCDMN